MSQRAKKVPGCSGCEVIYGVEGADEGIEVVTVWGDEGLFSKEFVKLMKEWVPVRS